MVKYKKGTNKFDLHVDVFCILENRCKGISEAKLRATRDEIMAAVDNRLQSYKSYMRSLRCACCFANGADYYWLAQLIGNIYDIETSSVYRDLRILLEKYIEWRKDGGTIRAFEDNEEMIP